MSDRIFSYTVLLDAEYRDDDAETIQRAIEMIRGVASVVPIVSDPALYFAVETARNDLLGKVIDIVQGYKGVTK